MKVVLDSNILISAFITQGLSNRLFERCIDKHQIYISRWIINEIINVFENKFKINKKLLIKIKKYIYNYFIIIDTSIKEAPVVCRDKDDNNILLLAEIIKADIIITGDKDLLDLKNYKNIKIINPRMYYEDFEKK